MLAGTHFVTVDGVPWCQYTLTLKQVQRMVLEYEVPSCGGSYVECERYAGIIKRIIDDDTVKIKVVRGICPSSIRG